MAAAARREAWAVLADISHCNASPRPQSSLSAARQTLGDGDKFAAKKPGAGAPVGYNLAMSPVAMSITLNGESRTFSSTATVRDLILELGLDEDAVAVERNRAIVRRRYWAETMLRSGDRIEVVRFVGGG